MSPIRVLIVDDSRLMRNLLTSIMQKDQEIQVVGGADNGVEALDKIRELQPDVVALDLNMPVMDGVTVLKEAKTRQLPTTFLVISSLAKENAQITLEAISAGAIDFITKPPQALNIEQLSEEIISKIHVANGVQSRNRAGQTPAALTDTPPPPEPIAGIGLERPQRAVLQAVRSEIGLSVFGGSSGSIQTLRKIIPYLRGDLASSVVLVLPLPPFFVTQFALELEKSSPIPVVEVTENTTLDVGKVYVCPGGRNNIILVKDDDRVFFRSIENVTDKIYTPSIDVFMETAAVIFQEKCQGIIISGTGNDGVSGLTEIRSRGGKTYCEEAASAVAKQLPEAALESGVVEKALDIPSILRLLK